MRSISKLSCLKVRRTAPSLTLKSLTVSSAEPESATTGENNPERHAYAMTHGNNGQEWELPTYTDAKGNQFQFTNGQFGREWMGPYMQAEAMNSLADNLNLPSNRAMKKPEQRRYNGGVHWVSG